MAVNKQISALVLAVLATVLAAALILAATFGGGAKRTVASRSAAAFRAALQKGEPVTEESHGHGVLAPGAVGQPVHAEHGGSETKEPEHAEHDSPGMAGHGVPPSRPSGDPHAMHGTSRQADRPSPAQREGRSHGGGHAGMEHERTAGSASPGEPMAGAPVVPTPGPKAAEASPGQPAATLRPDPLDQPPATSLEEAKRAAEMAKGMGDGHGMQHGTSSYRQLDAGRDSRTTEQDEGRVVPRAPTSPDHGGMQHGSPPASTPKPPAVRKPPPSTTTPGAPPPESTQPPHHSGGGDRTP